MNIKSYTYRSEDSNLSKNVIHYYIYKYRVIAKKEKENEQIRINNLREDRRFVSDSSNFFTVETSIRRICLRVI